MSVRTMARVWESSQHAGSDLLMLLAIADFSDDDGNAYPAVATLAAKCRMKERNCRYILRTLEGSGELSIKSNAGPHGSNLYRVNLTRLGLQHSAGVQSFAGLQHSAATPAKDCRQPLQHSAANPSVNHQEPSTRHDAAKQRRVCSPSASESADDGFATFWAQYPKKVAKPQALKAWKKIKPAGQLLASLMAALDKQKASADWLKDGGQFIPHPATWLNGRRWEDEAPQAAGQTPATTSPKPGDIRKRWGADEIFDETMGWIPA
ncbi:helix-turn-helix domain-containing protein [Quatrionicoccus australiensis]|uniref:helix-turn-helix domain-containing protein n=1 Tax=Quatrionicoccus australiensis TaxID=138118 RepID=UPI001CF8FBCD|nr:helix-turn-helix domain-containing protein [Quatrionicoccus australiensis]UCV15520.1 helix-turn-helix domain-containing protein [Quatrionicoccus australiensis]